MIDQFLKVLLSEKSRVSLQISIFVAIVLAAFYAGQYAHRFTMAQAEALEEQKKITKAIEELVGQSKGFWTYQMQKEYDNALGLNEDGTLRKANLSEIREKFSN